MDNLLSNVYLTVQSGTLNPVSATTGHRIHFYYVNPAKKGDPPYARKVVELIRERKFDPKKLKVKVVDRKLPGGTKPWHCLYYGNRRVMWLNKLLPKVDPSFQPVFIKRLTKKLTGLKTRDEFRTWYREKFCRFYGTPNEGGNYPSLTPEFSAIINAMIDAYKDRLSK